MSKAENHWISVFTDIGAFWFHDGNQKRPYARLTSGKISNGFFNGGKVCEYPHILAGAVEHFLTMKFDDGLIPFSDLSLADDVLTQWVQDRATAVVVGPAMGGITLAHEIARQLKLRMIFAEKEGEGFAFKRCEAPSAKSTVILCEDTITTGGSVLKVQNAIAQASPNANIAPMVLALLNRSGNPYVETLKIRALIDKPISSWNEGENPFTPGGRELVEPVKPKANWQLLTQPY